MGNTQIASENRKVNVKEAFKLVLSEMNTTPSYLVAKEFLIERFGEKVVNDHKKTLTNLLKERCSIEDYVIKSFSSGDMNKRLIHLGKSRDKDTEARLRKTLMPFCIEEITRMMNENPSTKLTENPQGILLCLGKNYGGRCIHLKGRY